MPDELHINERYSSYHWLLRLGAPLLLFWRDGEKRVSIRDDGWLADEILMLCDLIERKVRKM